jgi:glutamyl-tRNA synthetase
MSRRLDGGELAAEAPAVPAPGADTPVRVRMAPSPTGALHLGGVRTALFNWLFARNRGGEFLVRIENTDTSREVQGAVEHALESLSWLGLDWDRPPTFQLDRQGEAEAAARKLVEEGKAYEDEGAIRFRMPDEGVTAWDDLVKGRIEFKNEELDDLVILRGDGRPTYNFASPLEDVLDGITHVIRGDDHISNTPRQINVIRALGGEPPLYAHVPNVLGEGGAKLSKRHGATGVDELRAQGYYAPALLNFLALLGWSYDDKTTIMSRDELVSRFSLDRVQSSPARFDYEKLRWMNGEYLRALPAGEYADALLGYLRDQDRDWDEATVRATAPLVQEKIATFGEYPEFAGFFFTDDVTPGEPLDPEALRSAERALEPVQPWEAAGIEEALRAMADELGAKPRQAFQPVRVAVTGSRVSPGLFESLELLGKERSLGRIRSAAAAAA